MLLADDDTGVAFELSVAEFNHFRKLNAIRPCDHLMMVFHVKDPFSWDDAERLLANRLH